MKKKITVYLEPDLYDKLKEAASKNKTSPTKHLRALVVKALTKRIKRTPTKQQELPLDVQND